MLNTPCRPKVDVKPLFKPWRPNPSFLIISLAVAIVLPCYSDVPFTKKEKLTFRLQAIDIDTVYR